MDAPHRQLDAAALERLAPGEHVLVHAVHQRAVEIEQEGGAACHRCHHLRGRVRVGTRAESPGSARERPYGRTPSRARPLRARTSGPRKLARHFNSMSCGLACPVARCSKSTSNLESSARPFGVTFTSCTRYGTLPSRFESSELLTYSRLLSGVSFSICAWGMATLLTSLGFAGSAMSYCCSAPPPNSDT